MTIPKHLETYTYQPAETTLVEENDNYIVFCNKEKEEYKDKSIYFTISYRKGIDKLSLDTLIYLESQLNTERYNIDFTFDTSNDELDSEETVPLFVSTMKHITTGVAYNSEELETFSEKQLAELAMYASIDQFNIISRLERKYPSVTHSLAIRYLILFTNDDSICDFCESYGIKHNIYSFMAEVNLEMHYYVNRKIVLSALLSRLDTPPTYECLQLFHEHHYEEASSFFGFSDNWCGTEDFFCAIDGLEDVFDKDTFISGYNKHFVFAVEAALHLVNSGEAKDFALSCLSDAMDNIHRSGLDKEWILKLFNFKYETHYPEYVSGWGDNWATTFYFDFNKGSLFELWIAHKHQCWSRDGYDKENMTYILNNFEEFLQEDDFNFEALIDSNPEQRELVVDYLDIKTAIKNILIEDNIQCTNYNMLEKIVEKANAA